MNRISQKLHSADRRKFRVRTKIAGDAGRPRLSVHISNRHVSAQIIDDAKHRTLAQITTVGVKSAGGNMTERAVWVGAEVAKKAKEAKIKAVIFDRGSRKYHGRVKALADAARAGGLEF